MRGMKGFGAALVVAATALLAVPAVAAAAVLHDQNSGGNGTGFFSQTDTDSMTFSELADDFVVPAGETWTIQGIEVSGHYDAGSGPTSGINVRIYSTSGVTFLPDTQLFSELGIVPANGTTGPDFSIPVTNAPALTAGQYWVSVQAAGLNYPDNIWDWNNRAPAVGDFAAARTSDLGACMAPTWVSRTTMGCGGNADVPDQMFSLSDTPPTPPNGGGGGDGGGGTATPPGNPTSPVNPAGNVRQRKCKKKQKAAAIAKKKKCKKQRK